MNTAVAGSMKALLACAVLAAGPLLAARPAVAQGETARGELLLSRHLLRAAPGQQFTALTLDVPPGQVIPRHYHAGFVFAHVLAGTLRSQLDGGRTRTYPAGQSWIEPQGSAHTRLENPSRTRAARLLAVFVAPAGARLTTLDK